MSSGPNNYAASPIQNFQMLLYKPARADNTALVEAILANPLFFESIDNFLISAIVGTANEVIVTPYDGLIVLSTPQPIATGSSVTFGALTTSSGPVLHNLGGGNLFTLQQSGTTFLQAGTGIGGYNVNMTNVNLQLASSGDSNIFIGVGAGNSDEAGVVAIGPGAGVGATSAINSIFIGHNTCTLNPRSNMVAIGPFVLANFSSNGSATASVSIGTSALGALTSGNTSNSVVLGYNALTLATIANVSNGVYIGQNVAGNATVGDLSNSVVIGNNAMGQITNNATPSGNVVIGASAINSQTGIAISNSVAIGMGVATTGTSNVSNSVVVGYEAVVGGNNAVALGTSASASAANSTALGAGSAAYTTGCVALGTSASASGANSLALGAGSAAYTTNSVALGPSASASGTNSVALGTNAIAPQNNTIILGQNGTVGSAGTLVGIGLTGPLAMLHIKDSAYGLDTNIILECDSANSGPILTVDHTGCLFYNPALTTSVGYAPSYFEAYQTQTITMTFFGPWVANYTGSAVFTRIGNIVAMNMTGIFAPVTNASSAQSNTTIPPVFANYLNSNQSASMSVINNGGVGAGDIAFEISSVVIQPFPSLVFATGFSGGWPAFNIIYFLAS